MCSVSATIEDYRKDWFPNTPWYPSPTPFQPATIPLPQITPAPLPSQIDINKFFKDLADAARRDVEDGQKDCEKPELVDLMQKLIDRVDNLHRSIEKTIELVTKPKAKKARKPKKLTLLK